MHKKTMIILAVTAVVLGGTYLGSQLFAQVPGQPAAPTQTRVGFVNMLTVIKKYEKAQFFKTEYDAVMKEFQGKTKELNEYIGKVQKYIKANKLAGENLKKYQDGIVSAKRQLEDLNRTYSARFKDMNERQTPQIYKEIEEAVRKYARANGYHAVFAHYSFDSAERISMRNIIRVSQGMQGTGCVMSMYMAPGLDISEGVARSLNGAFRAQGGPNSLKNTSYTPRK